MSSGSPSITESFGLSSCHIMAEDLWIEALMDNYVLCNRNDMGLPTLLTDLNFSVETPPLPIGE